MMILVGLTLVQTLLEVVLAEVEDSQVVEDIVRQQQLF
jgi:hypothetical protein